MNLKALAAHLGLSQATVSRALNGYTTIAPETRERVVAAAAAHGYRPNQSARSLATGRVGAIGIVFTAEENVLQDPVFLEFLRGAAEWAAERGMSLNLSATTARDEIARYRDLARSRQVDGFIISGPAIADARIAALQAMGVPFVCHGRTQSQRAYAHLDIDNEGGFRRATQLLLDMGHRRIALINGSIRQTFARDRADGYAAAHRQAGVVIDPALPFAGRMTEENGYLHTRAALQLADRPTAFLCGSMIVALGCLRAVREAGLDIPSDVSVIAHDDVVPFITPESQRPALTTTRSAIRLHGRRIAEMLMSEVEDHAPLASLILPVELVMRDSVAPHRS